MTPSYQTWTVSGYMRPVFDQRARTDEWEPTGAHEPVVVVSDPRGWSWEITAENGQLTSVTVRPATGAHLDQRALSLVPVGYLRDVATTYLNDVERAFDEGMRIEDAFREADRARGEVVTPDGSPSSEEFAEAWRATGRAEITERGTARIPRRDALAERYGVSVYAIDKWTKRARDLGLIEPVPGKRRGRRPETTDGK